MTHACLVVVLFKPQPINPFFLAHFHRSNAWTDVDGLINAFWPFGCADGRIVLLRGLHRMILWVIGKSKYKH